MEWSDRHDKWKYEGGYMVAVGMLLGGGFVPIAAYATGRHMPFPFILLIPIGALAGYTVGKAIAFVTVTGSGRAAQSVYMPATAGMRGSEHSEIDTLEVRGNFKAAADAWDAVAIAEPDNAWPLVRAGELYARNLGEPALAVERFRQARSCPSAKPELNQYVSQKIVDLLLGPLNDPGRAMVELRMLIDRHPSSRAAEGAREALRRLKAELPS